MIGANSKIGVRLLRMVDFMNLGRGVPNCDPTIKAWPLPCLSLNVRISKPGLADSGGISADTKNHHKCC
jgi:hypothetical protein